MQAIKKVGRETGNSTVRKRAQMNRGKTLLETIAEQLYNGLISAVY
jgi:hypothetical protein